MTFKMRSVYARTLYEDADATVDDLREAVSTLEDTDRIARRVFGNSHPNVLNIERNLEDSRAALDAREAQSSTKYHPHRRRRDTAI